MPGWSGDLIHDLMCCKDLVSEVMGWQTLTQDWLVRLKLLLADFVFLI